MRGKIYSIENKEKVKQLILTGKSYNEITKILGVPKSTISTWYGKTLKKPFRRKTMLSHLKSIRPLATEAIKRKWNNIREKEEKNIGENVKREIKNYPLNNIGFYKALLSMLYWAEGSKYDGASGTKFANTDPNLALLYITLLRKCYNINERKFRIGLYVHYYHSIKKVKKFWSKLLNVPSIQFIKIYIKKRSKAKRFRKNFAGICFIYYGDSKIRKELLEIGSVLKKIITKDAPVAQWIEHLVADQKIAGSTPAGRI